jgi:hypothetical protein
MRVYMAEAMTIKHFLAVSPFVQYGIIGALIVWTVWFSRGMRRRVEAAWAHLVDSVDTSSCA